jgi:hypothetical protein
MNPGPRIERSSLAGRKMKLNLIIYFKCPLSSR